MCPCDCLSVVTFSMALRVRERKNFLAGREYSEGARLPESAWRRRPDRRGRRCSLSTRKAATSPWHSSAGRAWCSAAVERFGIGVQGLGLEEPRSPPPPFPSPTTVDGGQELWFHCSEATVELRLELRFQQTGQQVHPEQVKGSRRRRPGPTQLSLALD